eukprot:scaffold113397_cov62-Attheya_sp.AAC.1
MAKSQDDVPLVSTSNPASDGKSSSIRLYDAESVLEIPRDVASGFLILLSGGNFNKKSTKGKKQKKTRETTGGEKTSEGSADIDESTLALAFLALTDGNVVDACFGVQQRGRGRSRGDTSSRSYNSSKAAKQAIAEASHSSDAVRLMAVEAYGDAFRSVVEYQSALHDMNFISWCFRYANVHKAAEKHLNESFERLNEALAAST